MVNFFDNGSANANTIAPSSGDDEGSRPMGGGNALGDDKFLKGMEQFAEKFFANSESMQMFEMLAKAFQQNGGTKSDGQTMGDPFDEGVSQPLGQAQQQELTVGAGGR